MNSRIKFLKCLFKNGLSSLLAVFLLLGVLSGCESSSQKGMNELTISQLKKKFENHETFILFSFTANNNDIEKTKLIDAFHDSFRRAGLTAYYINVGEMGNKEAQKLSQTYIHPKSENMWNPFFSLSLVENGGVNTLMTKEMTSKEAKDLFKKEAKDNVNHLEEISSIDRDVKKILEYIQVSQISLTDQKGSTN